MRLAEEEDIPFVQEIMQECVDAGGVPQEAVEDVAGIIKQGACVLVDESMRGCVVLVPIDPKSVEAHVAMKPAHRGHDALEMVQQAANLIFLQSSIEDIYTRCGRDDKHVRAFCQWIGMQPLAGDVWKLNVERHLAMAHDVREAYDSFVRAVPTSKGLPIYNRMAHICHWPILKEDENGFIIQDARGC